MLHIYRILYARPDGSTTGVVSVHEMAQAGTALQQSLRRTAHGWTSLNSNLTSAKHNDDRGGLDTGSSQSQAPGQSHNKEHRHMATAYYRLYANLQSRARP